MPAKSKAQAGFLGRIAGGAEHATISQKKAREMLKGTKKKGLPERVAAYGNNPKAKGGKSDKKKAPDKRSARVEYTPPKSTPESRARRKKAAEKRYRKENPAGAAAMDIKKTVDDKKSMIKKFLDWFGVSKKKK